MFVTPHTPDLDDAATTSDVGVYVAAHLLAGRSLFAILDDPFIQDRLDEHPFLLDELARATPVRSIDDPARRGSTRLRAPEPGRRARPAA